jgi:glycosyltransferase involved in cell wall biosynthesis
MNDGIKLSICMMIKNEEKNLKRCLNALKSLIAKPDVELVIIDTGSTDQSVPIANQYTERVYFHPWNNHFSEMRNITISYAKGDRILILDADEVLLNAQELYELVSDVRLQSYNTFVLKIKNFIDANKDYTILPQERVFRNDGDFRYDGAVHNQPKCKKPFLVTDVYLDHYGYLSNDKDMQERKFKRTGTILEEELKKNPNSIYYRYQMAKSYDAHGDHKEALDEIRTAYRLITDNKKNKLYIFGEYALICLKNCEYEELVKVCIEGLEIEPDYIDLYYFKAESLQKLGRNQEALETYTIYVELSEKYNSLDISSDRSIEMLFMSNTSKDVALSFIINELFSRSKYEDAVKYANLVFDEKVKTAFLFKIFLKLKKQNELRPLYHQSIQNKNINEILVALAEEERNILNQNDKKELELLFSTSDDAYSLLNRIRTNNDDQQQLVEKIIKMSDCNELPDFYADMFSDFDKNPRVLFSFLKQFPKMKIKNFSKRLIDAKYGFKGIFEEYLLKGTVRDNDYNSLKLYTGISYAVLFHEAGTLNKDAAIISDHYNIIFKAYVNTGIKLVTLLYNTDRLRLYYNTLENQEDRFFIALHYAGEAVAKGDYRSGIRYFGEAARANPFMSCYMNNYKDKLFFLIDMKSIEG